MTSPSDPHPIAHHRKTVRTHRRRIGVFVLVDGLGYELVRASDFLPDFELRVGLRSGLGPVDAVHASLFSGRNVCEHQITARWVPTNHSGALEGARTWGRLPGVVANAGWVRNRLRRELAERYGPAPSLPECPTRLLARFELGYDGELFGENTAGAAASIFHRLSQWGVRWSAQGGDVPEALTFDLAHRQLRESGCEFLLLRLPRLGDLLERHGSAHEQIREQLDRLTRDLRRLQQVAEELAEEVEFFVFGDRAALDVHGYVDLAGQVESAFGRNADRVLAFYHATLARFWSENEATREELESYLHGLGQGRLVLDEELRALGWPALSPDLASLFVLDPGLAIAPNFIGRRQPSALAGYHPELPQCLAALLGSFSPSLDVREVRMLYELMEATAGRILQDRA